MDEVFEIDNIVKKVSPTEVIIRRHLTAECIDDVLSILSDNKFRLELKNIAETACLENNQYIKIMTDVDSPDMAHAMTLANGFVIAEMDDLAKINGDYINHYWENLLREFKEKTPDKNKLQLNENDTDFRAKAKATIEIYNSGIEYTQKEVKLVRRIAEAVSSEGILVLNGQKRHDVARRILGTPQEYVEHKAVPFETLTKINELFPVEVNTELDVFGAIGYKTAIASRRLMEQCLRKRFFEQTRTIYQI